MKNLLLVFIAVVVTLTSCKKEYSQSDDQVLFIGDSIAIANTSYGKVKGYIYKDVYTYLGIPYGASTAGHNRFMPPQEPTPWKVTKATVFYGNSAPQNIENQFPNNYDTFINNKNCYDVSENCLSLNVWTPGIDSAKRPVLVWLHGGGIASGNAIEQDSYDGNNISRNGNIVFCSVNYRLGAIGFSDLSAYGEKYKSSGNVGMLDIIAALKWVNKNIVNFGGDPDNVTIMGQSSGGARVCTILAMEQAKGLVNKAVALSGNSIGAIDQNFSRELGSYILKEAGLKPAEVDKLQEIPWNEYIKIADNASKALAKDKGTSIIMRGNFGPIADSINIPKETFFSNLDGYAAKVPLLLSTTENEFSINRDSARLEAMSQDELEEFIKNMKGDKAYNIVKAYSKAFPDKKPIELLSMIVSPRDKVISTANAKCAQSAPVYMALFAWGPPMFDGRMRAFNCLDVSFWFKNTDNMYTQTGGGKRPRKLAKRMSAALVEFMKTGDPNCSSLPAWPVYTPKEGKVMILNDKSIVQNDPDREARKEL
ncbi:MAG: carboxylesterase family protein [Bacteroidales bacterium]|nr:carboxylesterase family protein [Bacteroidales bacterium]